MKKIIIIFCLNFMLYFQVQSQDYTVIKEDSVEVFLVYRYLKKEIRDYMRNKILQRRKNKIFIDLTVHVFVFKTSKDSLVREIRKWDVFYKKDLYILPISIHTLYFSDSLFSLFKVKLKEIDVEKCPFMKIKGDNKYIYKIVYIKGLEKVISFPNNQFNRDAFFLSEAISNKSDFFNIHLIYILKETKCINQISNIKELKEWAKKKY